MGVLHRWWKVLLGKLHNKCSVPASLDDSGACCVIHGIAWPSDVSLVRGDDSQVFLHKSPIEDGDFRTHINGENTDKQPPRCKDYKLRVWKTESLTIEVVNEDERVA